MTKATCVAPNRPAAGSAARLPPGLYRLVQRIRDPANYQVGLPPPDLALPVNMVLFNRRPNFLPIHPPMAHDGFVLIVNLKGAGCTVLDNLMVPLSPGQGLLIFPFQFHHYIRLQETRLLWLFITFQLANAAALTALKNTPVTLAAPAGKLAQRLARDYLSPQAASPYVSAQLSVNLWLLLLELVASLKTRNMDVPTASPPMTHPVYPRIQKTLQFIRDRQETPLTIRAVAGHLGLSPSHLCRQFQAAMGLGLGAYIRRTRISQACRLMSACDESLSQIAERCGFSSPYAFSRTFKAVMRAAPNRYRAQLRKRRPL